MRGLDSGKWLRISGHLDRILDLPPDQWTTGLDVLRREDPEIAADVASMLDQHRRLNEEGFLATAPSIQPVETTLAGVKIGAYTLESLIGYGGMGSVWRAARSDGRFEGYAALKLLNAALIGHGGEERFKREGTILARLTHPNIARLIDAGVSTTGQPYLVLELIKGRHIDAYCDDERLSIEERIRLFLDVQAAVAHAHANLVVHRDLKPSNVLVSADGQVKLLDFSIAKLIEDHPDQARLTREAGAAMTPKYAAPEQVTGGPITTATDVYSLGVLLYELLSGRHPAGDAKTPSDFIRALADTETPRLSTMVTPNADGAALVAASRATTPERLRRTLHGDLDTILAKALKKNPAERYGSVAEFADDLRRYVDQKPISARPETLRYRSAKFMRRHWQGLTVGVTTVLLMIATASYYAIQLAAERDRARIEAEKASRVSDLMTKLVLGVDPYRTPDARQPSVANLLANGADSVTRELADQPQVQTELLNTIGRTYQRLGMNDKALPILEQALAIGRRTFGPSDVRIAQSLNDLGVLQRAVGNPEAALPLLTESLAMRRLLLGSNHKDVAVTLVEQSRVLGDLGQLSESTAPALEALDIRRRIFGEEHRETATSKAEVARIWFQRGDLDRAEKLYREALDTTRTLLGDDHPNVSANEANVAAVLSARGQTLEAERLLRESLATDQKVFGAGSVDAATTMNNLALVLEVQGRLEEAARMFDDALRIATPQLRVDHPRLLTMSLNAARVRIAMGKPADTEAILRHVLERRQATLRAGDWRIAQAQSVLASSLLAQRRIAEAQPLMEAADQILKPVPGVQGREYAANRARLSSLPDRSRSSK
jgi:serine/threonine protein kinase/Tfp pilus assembly protein PilF